MGLGHDHGHDHTHGANKKVLFISFIIISIYMVVEVIGGFLTHSLALLSDAGHMFSDAISLGVGLLAFTLGERVADRSKTYGYRRFEILAAVFNGVTLVVIALFIFVEAIRRLQHPPEINSSGMMIIAVIGLFVNIAVAWLMFRGGDTKDNLNLRAAFLHVIGDMLGSVGAIVAAILIMTFNWGWADPVASVLVAVLVLISGVRVSKDAIHVLMEGTPANINLDEIVEIILSIPGIINIHDVHIWSITSGHNAMSAHIVVDGQLTIDETQMILEALEAELEKNDIHHVTVQMENPSHLHDNSVLCQAHPEIAHHHHQH